MFNTIINKIKFFYQSHPYLTTIIILIVASLIGITIQYVIDGTIIKSGFYTASLIALVSLISKWRKKNK